MATFRERVEETIQEQNKIMAQAYKDTPVQYQQYIKLLDQSKVVANREMELSSDLAQLGLYTMRGKTYLNIRVPYFTVDGRLAVFADRHRKEDGSRYRYNFSSNAEKINEIIGSLGHRPPDDYLMIVRVESDLCGCLEGVSRIFWGGQGANASNPVEVAYTSATGRALAQAGIGLIGTGIASADEVTQAIEEQGAREYPVRRPVNESAPSAEPTARSRRTQAAPTAAAFARTAVTALPVANPAGSALAGTPSTGAPSRNVSRSHAPAASAAAPAPAAEASAGAGVPGDLYVVRGVRDVKAGSGRMVKQVALEKDGRTVVVYVLDDGLSREIGNLKPGTSVRATVVTQNNVLELVEFAVAAAA